MQETKNFGACGGLVHHNAHFPVLPRYFLFYKNHNYSQKLFGLWNEKNILSYLLQTKWCRTNCRFLIPELTGCLNHCAIETWCGSKTVFCIPRMITNTSIIEEMQLWNIEIIWYYKIIRVVADASIIAELNSSLRRRRNFSKTTSSQMMFSYQKLPRKAIKTL